MSSPISIEHLRRKLGEMKADMDAGKLRHGDYDQRLARLISEMRERKLDADRPAIATALDELLQEGVITPAVKDHVSKRLGLA